MKYKDKKIILNIVLIIYSIVSQILLTTKLLRYTEYISATVILIVMYIAICIYGFRKDNKTTLKTTILYRTIFFVILFFSITYLLGLIVGFNDNAYSQKILLLINNTLAPVIIVMCTEVYRYIIVNSTNDKKIIIFLTIALIIFEALISIRITSFLTIVGAFKVITISIIPIISKNIVMTYLTKKGGLMPSLVYRLIIDTYIYIIPIIPNFNDYINSMIGICFPIVLYIDISKVVDENEKVIKMKNVKENYSIIDFIIIGVIVIFIMLLSGFFPYSIMGIGSNSMYPVIKRGDAVVYRKVNKEDIKEKDILVYDNKEKKKVIIHRIVKIEKDNDNYYYITKGDANNVEDKIRVEYKNVKGIVKFKVKYVALPTIYLGEYFKRRS